MARPFKCVWTFAGSRGTGWSELLYLDAADLKAAELVAIPIRDARMALAASATVLQTQRLVDVADPRVTTLEDVEQGGFRAGTHDMPQIAVGVRLDTGTGMHRTYYLRGGVDDDVQGGHARIGGRFRQLLTIFTDTLKFGGRVLLYGQDRSIPRFNVQSITAPGVVTTVGNHTITAGSTVEFLRTRNASNKVVKLEYGVASVTANTLTLYSWDGGVPLKLGQVRRKSRVFDSIATTSYINSRIRKVGRPFGAFRGRASKRA